MKTKTAPKKRRSALGADPLDALLEPSKARKGTPAKKPSTRKDAGENGTDKSPKVRTTFHLSGDLVNKLRDAVYWTPGLTLAGLAENALRDAVGTLEKKRGKPFPKREADLKGGRPIGS